MGYSCSAMACEVFDAVLRLNEFDPTSLSFKYFTEIGRENKDGSITGTVYVMLSEERCKRIGTFKIGPNGEIKRFAGLSKRLWGVAEIAGIEAYDRRFDGWVRLEA